MKLAGMPRWVSARGGPYDRHILRGAKTTWAVLESRDSASSNSRFRYTCRVLMAPIATEVADQLLAEGWSETAWRWDR